MESTEVYEKRRLTELRNFDNRITVHDLPAIYHYWSERYLRPKLAAAGFESLQALFCNPLISACSEANGPVRFLSIGAGNCDMELEWAGDLVSRGHSNFVIDCLDLNPTMLERGTATAAAKGLSPHFGTITADFNEWRAALKYDVILANQSLHHVTNLEGLLDEVRSALTPGGRFIVSDMIGRNGHVRWPEARKLINEFWAKLPPAYRYNWQLKRYEAVFEDWDCSVESFEGIRSQDILPLLIERFHFDIFLAVANVIDPFIERSFGHNFNIEDPMDRAFIDEIHHCDEEAIQTGRITPTHLFAVLDLNHGVPPRYSNPADIAACVRDPHLASEEPTVEQPVWPAGAERTGQILYSLANRCRELEQQLTQVQAELESRTRWALEREAELTQDLESRTQWARRLEGELEDRTRWALSMQEELESWRAAAPQPVPRRWWERAR